MFLGYAKNHTGNCYRLLHLKTRKVIKSRDVIWLNKINNEKVTIVEEADVRKQRSRSIGGLSINVEEMMNEDEENGVNDSHDEDNDEEGISEEDDDNNDGGVATRTRSAKPFIPQRRIQIPASAEQKQLALP